MILSLYARRYDKVIKRLCLRYKKTTESRHHKCRRKSRSNTLCKGDGVILFVGASAREIRFRKGIKQIGARLLILDPLSSYIGDDCSLNAANETRAAFNHLISVAKDTGCAIVIVAHMNKMRESSPLYRTSGSIDIAGAARSILAVARTPDKSKLNERVMVQVKSNLAPTGSAILFEVGENGVVFIDEIELTAEEAFACVAPKRGRPSGESDAATDFILGMMEAGKLPASECEARLKSAGFKKSTVKKAKKNAGVLSVKEGFTWYWTFPEDAPESPAVTADDDMPFE